MLLDKEADAVAAVGRRVPLCLLDHLAGGDTPQRGHVVKPDFGKTIDDRLRAGLHKGDTIFPHLGEFLYIRDVALQPPLGERLPAHIGAAFEAGGKLVAGRRRMINNRMLRQVQALSSCYVRVGVGTGCLACRASEGRLGCRQVIEPEFGHAIKRTLLLISSGERDDILAQPRKLLGEGPVLAQPPVEEERLRQVCPALLIDHDTLHRDLSHVTCPWWQRPGARSADRRCCSAAASGPHCYGNTVPPGPRTWE